MYKHYMRNHMLAKRILRTVFASSIFLWCIPSLLLFTSLPEAAGLLEDTPDQSDDFIYRNYEAYSDAISTLQDIHGNMLSISSIGESHQGRLIYALRLAMQGAIEPDNRPAMLIVAGIDGTHIVGSDVAVNVAMQLLNQAASNDKETVRLLTEQTIYIVPRVNPDPMELFFADVRTGMNRNFRAHDIDRDRMVDEDPPNDLNGDGLITMMRVIDKDKAELCADPNEHRLNVTPDVSKEERPAFIVYTEGIDDDDDGEYNEDAIGGVDLNMNFMHGYQEHADGAGPYPVSEPESLALLKYVLSHQNIVAVITYGLHDNLTNTPNGKGTYPPGTPINIVSGDLKLYKFIGKQFQDITDIHNVTSNSSDGAFYSWAYAQFGVPSFATPLWGLPKSENNNEEGSDSDSDSDGDENITADEQAESHLTPSSVGDISQETLDELLAAAEEAGFEVTAEMTANMTPEIVEQYATMSGVKIQRVTKQTSDTATITGSARNKTESAWLKYNDDFRDGEGFVNWTTYNHPQLGSVEIGGWDPYFKINPPANSIPDIVTTQTEFIVDLAGRFPVLNIADVQIIQLASGLYEVKCALVNDGFLPTGTAMAVRNKRARPLVLQLDVDLDHILSGSRVTKIWSLAGSGGRKSFRWIIRAADQSIVTIKIHSEKFQDFSSDIKMIQNEDGQE